ncbi:MAG: hypothetical protein JNK23_21830, partial [Opitutaceae bacterium]|nr:hypothetical protein [Opitutaceae bacterium]
VTAADAASYTLVATNAAGSATSNAAVLTVTAGGTGQPVAWVGSATGAQNMELLDGWGEGGLRFVVGSENLTVTALGFLRSPSTYAAPTLRLRHSSGVLATLAVPPANAPVGQFAYADLPAPVVLLAGQTYWITFQYGGYNGSYTYASDAAALAGISASSAATLLGTANASGQGGSYPAFGAAVSFKHSSAANLIAP